MDSSCKLESAEYIHMAYVKRLYGWLSIPGPLYLILLLIGTHISSLIFLPEISQLINLYCSPVFQFLGGLCIIFSINSNLNILSGSSIINSIIGWFKAFPGKGKSYDYVGNITMTFTPCGKVKCTPKMESIEEKVEYLFEEIERLEKESNESKEELKAEIRKAEGRLLPKINSLGDETRDIKAKMNNVLVGGAKLEALGVLIILYGLAIPVIWNI